MATRRNRINTRASSGLTLIEVLVVLAVLAVVLAVALPVLWASRDSGRQAKCLSQLRTLRDAVEMYRNDHSDLFPYAESEASLYPVPRHEPYEALASYLNLSLPGEVKDPRQAPAPLWCPGDRIQHRPSGISYTYMPWMVMATWPGMEKQRGASIALANLPDEPLFWEYPGNHMSRVRGEVGVDGTVKMARK